MIKAPSTVLAEETDYVLESQLEHLNTSFFLSSNNIFYFLFLLSIFLHLSHSPFTILLLSLSSLSLFSSYILLSFCSFLFTPSSFYGFLFSSCPFCSILSELIPWSDISILTLIAFDSNAISHHLHSKPPS